MTKEYLLTRIPETDRGVAVGAKAAAILALRACGGSFLNPHLRRLLVVKSVCRHFRTPWSMLRMASHPPVRQPRPRISFSLPLQ